MGWRGGGQGHVQEGSHTMAEKLGNMFRSIGIGSGGRRTGSGWGRVNGDQDWDSGDEDVDMTQAHRLGGHRPQDSTHLHPYSAYDPGKSRAQPPRPTPVRQPSEPVELHVPQTEHHPEFVSSDDERTLQHHHHSARSASHVTPVEHYGVKNEDVDSMPSTRASTPGIPGGGNARDATELTSPSVYSTWSYHDPFAGPASHPAPGPSIMSPSAHSLQSQVQQFASPVEMHPQGRSDAEREIGEGKASGKHDRQRSDDSHFSSLTFAGGSRFNEHIDFD